MAKKSLMKRLMGTRVDLAKAFQTQQQQALEVWRRCVEAHVDGQAVDIAELAAAGPTIGVPPTQISATFAADCEAMQLGREKSATVATDAQLAAEAAEAAKGAQAEINVLQEKLGDAIRRRDAEGWAAQALGHSSGDLQRHRAANPRLWAQPEEAISSMPAEEVEEPKQPVATAAASGPEFDADGTAWITDE